MANMSIQRKAAVLAYLAVVTSVIASLPSCAAVAAALPTVIAAIVDGGQVIDAIASFVSKYFAQHPDPEMQKKVDKAIMQCRQTLSAALHIAQATDGLQQEKIDQAFNEFKKAYTELINLVRPFGVSVSQPGQPLMATGDDHLEVPPAESFTPKVKK